MHLTLTLTPALSLHSHDYRILGTGAFLFTNVKGGVKGEMSLNLVRTRVRVRVRVRGYFLT